MAVEALGEESKQGDGQSLDVRSAPSLRFRAYLLAPQTYRPHTEHLTKEGNERPIDLQMSWVTFGRGWGSERIGQLRVTQEVV